MDKILLIYVGNETDHFVYGLWVDKVEKDKVIIRDFEKMQIPKGYKRTTGFFIYQPDKFIQVWVKDVK
jgi:hypothetical protein